MSWPCYTASPPEGLKVDGSSIFTDRSFVAVIAIILAYADEIGPEITIVAS